MNLIIIAILVIAGSLIYFHKDCGLDLENFLLSLLVGLAGLLVGLLVGFLIIFVGSSIQYAYAEPDDWTIVDHERAELIALKDGFHIEGTAFLFSSIVNDNLEYTYIYEEPDLGLTANTVEAKSVYIKYINADKTPYTQKWESRPKSNLINWLFCPVAYKYTIYLPQGSVIENIYEIDLE